MNKGPIGRGPVANISGLPNKGLHQTGRGGAAAARPVVEARPAGEARCSTGSSGSEGR